MLRNKVKPNLSQNNTMESFNEGKEKIKLRYFYFSEKKFVMKIC